MSNLNDAQKLRNAFRSELTGFGIDYESASRIAEKAATRFASYLGDDVEPEEKRSCSAIELEFRAVAVPAIKKLYKDLRINGHIPEQAGGPQGVVVLVG